MAIQDQQSVRAILKLSLQKSRVILLEFPNVLPAAFLPVLKSLQTVKALNRLPFAEWILPNPRSGISNVKLDVPPPLYARSGTFTFSLDTILQREAQNSVLRPAASTADSTLIADLEQGTGLDQGQCVALVAALTREFAFIQGPPGTGKSFLGVKLIQVILDTKNKARLGPVIIVCYTNHALDQFLEHLLAIGIKKIVRIGGQSRSGLLEEHNLRTISKSEKKTRHEGWLSATTYEKLKEYEDTGKKILGRLHNVQKKLEWKHLDFHMRQKYGRIHAQFAAVDANGYTLAGRHPFEIWQDPTTFEKRPEMRTERTPLPPNLANTIKKAEADIQSLNLAERHVLIVLWTSELIEKASGEFFELTKDTEDCQGELRKVHEEVDRRVLQGADVIGLTTSGLGKHFTTMQHVRSKVVLCEEAGEVMEPHIISAMLPSVEHFIQIGDHQQLRPSINNFRDLSLESSQGSLYKLDRSQFERLSVGDRGRLAMPIAQLNVQRRMRPDISTLIRETIYEKLVDHETTKELPDVVGMRKNVYWLDHDNLENEKDSSSSHNQSKSNDWEVNMVHALVRHVVRQGIYRSSDIAVLTPYTGQLQKLRVAMQNDFEIVLSERDEDALTEDGFSLSNVAVDEPESSDTSARKPLQKKQLGDLLRAATVDNFQGEEAKIVIVSLVRSNKRQKVGFLRTTNRINVLLSRAQHGMYLIGNADTYSNVPMWRKVVGILQANDMFGTSLELCCPRHHDTAIKIQQPDDFAKFSPEGGCREPCADRLPDCGHRCQARCHSSAMHKVLKCEQTCQRRHQPCGHLCQKPTCGEDCGKCMVIMNDVHLPCGHVKNVVRCYLTRTLDTLTCEELVAKTVTRCSHVVEAPCFEVVNQEGYLCPQVCPAILACGHPCSGTCSRCSTIDGDGNRVTKHVPCDRICGRRFGTCNHRCSRTCHDGSDCGLCESRCEVQCKHSRCALKCHESCAPCIERCTWSCPHEGDCSMPCSAPCNRLPCNKRCTLLLPCGHQCPGLCGEECLLDYCQSCGKHPEAQVDVIEFKEYREIDLDKDPVVALACNHFFTAQTLDGVIGLHEVYEFDSATTQPIKLNDIASELACTIPKCPLCQCPIRQFVTQRYNRLVNRAVIDEMSKRSIVTGQTELAKLQSRLLQAELEMERVESNIFRPHTLGDFFLEDYQLRTKLKDRYNATTQLRSAIKKLQRRTLNHSQPAHRLREAILHASRRNTPLDSALSSLSLEDEYLPSQYDSRITLGAKVLEIKIDCSVMEDKVRILSKGKTEEERGRVASLLFLGVSFSDLIIPMLQTCAEHIVLCEERGLPRLAVESTLYFARVARLLRTSGPVEEMSRQLATDETERAKTFLKRASTLCQRGFQDADTLSEAVALAEKSFQPSEWHEDVTAEELAAIKKAMVTGPKGIATHSGHWYNCANGHPFAIGECGMPMELARCPECGANIGGQHHAPMQGVTRAEDMEI